MNVLVDLYPFHFHVCILDLGADGGQLLITGLLSWNGEVCVCVCVCVCVWTCYYLCIFLHSSNSEYRRGEWLRSRLTYELTMPLGLLNLEINGTKFVITLHI